MAVEAHYRNETTGEITRSIFASLEEAQAQIAHDIAIGRTQQPFAIVEVTEHFKPNGESGVEPGATYVLDPVTVVEVVDQTTLDEVSVPK